MTSESDFGDYGIGMDNAVGDRTNGKYTQAQIKYNNHIWASSWENLSSGFSTR